VSQRFLLLSTWAMYLRRYSPSTVAMYRKSDMTKNKLCPEEFVSLVADSSVVRRGTLGKILGAATEAGRMDRSISGLSDLPAGVRHIVES
ncbi:hypothetical protein KIPB_017333, partial [Kipferlia bialata]